MKRRPIRFVLEARPVHEKADWKGRPLLTLKRAAEITGEPRKSRRRLPVSRENRCATGAALADKTTLAPVVSRGWHLRGAVVALAIVRSKISQSGSRCSGRGAAHVPPAICDTLRSLTCPQAALIVGGRLDPATK
jgi:hypothetical protein